VRAVENDHARARAQRIFKLLPVYRKVIQPQLHMHTTATRQFDRRLVAVVARIKHNDFIASMNHGLNGAENSLGSAGGDGHFSVSIHLCAIATGDLGRHLLTQRRQAGHWGVLVMATGNVLANCITQRLRAIEVREPLRQVECAGFCRELRHAREDGGADVRQLAGDHGRSLLSSRH